MSDTTKLEIELPEPYDRIATLISDDADAGLIEIPVFTAEQVRAAIEADRNKRAVEAVERIEKLEKMIKRAARHIQEWWLPDGELPPARSYELVEDIETLLASPAPDTSTPSTHPQEVSDEEILATFNSIRIKESGWSNTREQRDVVLKTVRAILAAQGRKA